MEAGYPVWQRAFYTLGGSTSRARVPTIAAVGGENLDLEGLSGVAAVVGRAVARCVRFREWVAMPEQYRQEQEGREAGRAGVLFISSNGASYGGGEAYLLHVMRGLDRGRFRPVVVLPEEGDLEPRLRELDVGTYVIPMRKGGVRQDRGWYSYLSRLPVHVEQVAAIIRAEAISLVHTNSNTRLEGALAARVTGTGHVYLAHIARQTDGLYQRLALDQGAFAEVASGLSSRIIAVSGAVAGTLSPPLPRSAVQVIHNGIDFADFDARAVRPGDVRAELGLGPEVSLVAAVGRLCHDKGFDVLVEAAAVVCREHQDAHFLLIGGASEAEYAARLEERVEALRIGDRIHFLGRREDVPGLLRESDLFVLSSRIEGHPYVLLEAMASNCGIVATRCAGVEETVAHEQTALLVPVDDAGAMAAAIARLLRDQALRKELARAADGHARERFSAQRSVEELMRAYEEILLEPAPTAGRAAVDLFLLAAREAGEQGLGLLDLKKRVADIEGTLDVVRKNRLVRRGAGVIRRVTGTQARSDPGR